ncbi:MAG: hypothetical protein FWF67_07730 [Fibromonadales bacterium]|nr:hypothetical protein [Fibromonadales bacterium]
MAEIVYKGQTINNNAAQEKIASMLAAEVKDAEGRKLSKSAIQAEMARDLVKKNIDQELIDFLVYGKAPS